jgi:hypothetical protein
MIIQIDMSVSISDYRFLIADVRNSGGIGLWGSCRKPDNQNSKI